MDNNDLERWIGARRGSEEVIKCPLQSVCTVLAIIDPNNHHLLLF
jgi:hypothetical protein